MKYHGHLIKKVPEDLGELDPRKNFIYEIYRIKDGEKMMNALTINSAKNYIDNNYDQRWL